MRHDGAAPGVVLSPHPDDAVLSAWSALRRADDVVVLNVFTGIPDDGVVGWADRSLGATDSAAHMRLRLDEDAAALPLAGCDGVTLGFLDEQYRDDDASCDELRAAIGAAVRAAAWLCVPAGLGARGDHAVVRDVGLELAQEAAIPVSLFADWPYAIEWGWPHWVTGREHRPFLFPEARWDRDLDALPVPRARLDPRVESLADAEMARKLEALETYRTQFTWLNAGPIDRLRNPEVLGFELCWDVRRG